MSDVESGHDGSSSSSEEEPEEVIRSRVPALSVTRERRANAGSKMASLIQDYAALTQSAENDNEFYNTAYGGFDEEAEDDEFDEAQEEADDELDSDFDAEEVEDAGDADATEEQDDSRRKRSSRRSKEAYEISAARRNKAAEKKTAAKSTKPKAKPQPAAQPTVKKSVDPVARSVVDEFLGKRSLRERKPVVRHDEDGPPVKKSKPSSSRNRSRRSKVIDEKKEWTQEELLLEAKETERENLASLQKYQLLELEKNEAKKRAKKSNREIGGPFIRFVSTSMPVIQTDNSDLTESTSSAADPILVSHPKTERTFITFSDDFVMDHVFPGKKSPLKRRTNPADIKRGSAICPISNLRARYFDPVTQMPYASSITFRVLRETYCNQLTAFYGKNLKSATVTEDGSASPNSPVVKKKDELQTWLDWRRTHEVRRTPIATIATIASRPVPVAGSGESTDQV